MDDTVGILDDAVNTAGNIVEDMARGRLICTIIKIFHCMTTVAHFQLMATINSY